MAQMFCCLINAITTTVGYKQQPTLSRQRANSTETPVPVTFLGQRTPGCCHGDKVTLAWTRPVAANDDLCCSSTPTASQGSHPQSPNATSDTLACAQPRDVTPSCDPENVATWRLCSSNDVAITTRCSLSSTHSISCRTNVCHQSHERAFVLFIYIPTGQSLNGGINQCNVHKTL